MKKLIPVIFIIIVMSACTPDPRKEAQALAIRLEAEQKAANEIQNRQRAEDLHQFQLQSLAMDQENSRAIQQQWQLALNRAIWIGSLTIILSVCFAIISVTRTTNKTIAGIGMAMVRRAELSASLVKLDPITRQFPLVIPIHNGRWAAFNANTEFVRLLDENNPSDRQMIATSGATQIAGVIAQEARQSADPAGVAIIQPPIVDVKDELLTVGKDIWRNDE